MNYAIIGCGLIGKKRLAGLPAGSKLVVACDTNPARAAELVKLAGAGRAVTDFKQAIANPEVDAVIDRLRQIVRDMIDLHVDEEQLKIIKVAEDSERELLKGLARVGL